VVSGDENLRGRRGLTELELYLAEGTDNHADEVKLELAASRKAYKRIYLTVAGRAQAVPGFKG